ncbi:MAG: hypothetical protein JO034_05100 [Singulisphaera sp.]|nr:hypothetical protein [Singulisphaera sp.]
MSFAILSLGILGFSLLMMLLGAMVDVFREPDDVLPRDDGVRDVDPEGIAARPVVSLRPARPAAREEATPCAR